MKNNIIFYCVLNRRDIDLLRQSIICVRKFVKYPIHIYHANCITNDDLKNIHNITLFNKELVHYPDNISREPYRNSDLWRFEIGSKYCDDYDGVLYLDNDIFVVHSGFFDGFTISAYTKKAIFPINPRGYILGIGGDGVIGADISYEAHNKINDMPPHMTAYNAGFFFANKHSKYFINACYEYMRQIPTRGPLVIGTVAWMLNDYPYVTSIKWLICKDHVNEKNPLALHVGHSEVMDRWKRDYI